MASTYVNDLRLEEIGTGDQSGTWGATTNTNLELIAEAFSFGTEAITTNADTHTTTIADGSTDPGRSMYLKYTGTLDSACTITIGPNTVSKMWFIENATSGSQNIIISQGSGANITIPPGDVKAVYSDGAGSGAAVVDAFASLSVVDLKVQDDLTVTDDLIVNGDIDLEGSIDVNGTTNLDVVDIDGAVDMASTLQVDGAITSSAAATITVSDNSDTLTLTSTDADANAGPNLRMYRNSGSPADNDYIGEIQFEGRNDNSQDVVYAGLAARILDASDGTEDGRFELFTIRAGSQISTMVTTATETVFNEDSIDHDFRVESDNFTHALFVQGSDGNVGIGGASAPAFENGNGLEIRNSSGNGSHLKLTDNASGTGATEGFDLYMFNSQGYIENYENAPTIFRNNGAQTMKIHASGCIDLGANVDRSLGTNITTTVTSGSAGSGFWLSTGNSSATSSKIFTTVNGSVGELFINQGSGVNGGSTIFEINDTQQFRVNSNGTVVVRTGILFGSDSAAANQLDDYEEGTFTPTFSSATLSTATGSYTKIGNQVTVHFRVITTGGLPSSGTQVQVGNLPFTIGTGFGGVGGLYVGPSNVSSATGGGGTIVPYVTGGETVIRFLNVDTGTFGYTLMGELEVSANNVITAVGTVTYTV